MVGLEGVFFLEEEWVGVEGRFGLEREEDFWEGGLEEWGREVLRLLSIYLNC